MSDLCRREGIKPHSYYSWTKEFMEAVMETLTCDSVRDTTREEVLQLHRENGESEAVGHRYVPGGLLSQKNGHPDASRASGYRQYQRMSGSERGR